VGVGIFRFKPDRLGVVGDGVLIVLFGGIGISAGDVGGSRGVDPNRFAVIGEGVFVVLLPGNRRRRGR
jgi:hypothetical protein